MSVIRCCPNCGVEVRPDANFCTSCRHQLRDVGARSSVSPHGAMAGVAATAELRYRISPTKIIVMSVLSWGLYFFYWFYLTWKHYREHTHKKAFPVWHAIAIGVVPVYSFFRIHAHMRSYNELISSAGQVSTISAGGAVLLAIVFTVLAWLSPVVGYVGASQNSAVAAFLSGVGSVAVGIILLCRVQNNLNRYWLQQSGGRLLDARIGVEEVILAVIGVLSWMTTIFSLFRESHGLG